LVLTPGNLCCHRYEKC